MFCIKAFEIFRNWKNN